MRAVVPSCHSLGTFHESRRTRCRPRLSRGTASQAIGSCCVPSCLFACLSTGGQNFVHLGVCLEDTPSRDELNTYIQVKQFFSYATLSFRGGHFHTACPPVHFVHLCWGHLADHLSPSARNATSPSATSEFSAASTCPRSRLTASFFRAPNVIGPFFFSFPSAQF